MASRAREDTVGPGVKRGGHRTARGFRFELDGGAPCLDLANTLDERPLASRRDNLESYADLLDWGEQSGLVSRAEATALRRTATSRPAAAGRALERMKSLREALFMLFSELAQGRPAPAPALDDLNQSLGRVYARSRLVPTPTGFRTGFDFQPTDLERLLFPVVQSAQELLTSATELERLRLCAAETCDWLFLDRSRNRSRRWCDMSVCGNRDKARRFYRRQE